MNGIRDQLPYFIDFRLYHVAGGGGELHLPVEGGLAMYLFAQSSITSMT